MMIEFFLADHFFNQRRAETVRSEISRKSADQPADQKKKGGGEFSPCGNGNRNEYDAAEKRQHRRKSRQRDE